MSKHSLARHSESLKITPSLERLFQEWIQSKGVNTLAAYRNDYKYFAQFLNVESEAEAAKILLSCRNAFDANDLVLRYRDSMKAKGLAVKTCNRRICSLKSLVTLAEAQRLISWRLTLKTEKTETYRDTKGPGMDGFRAMLKFAAGQSKEKAARDVAILWISFSDALRRAEVYNLDLSDFDLKKGIVQIIGKGKKEAMPMTIPPRALEALKEWVKVRGTQDGPMFFSMHHGRYMKARLTGDGFHHIISTIGKSVGINTRPHGLRHLGITAALETGASMLDVARFSRHADMAVIQIYDDRRRDIGGELAKKIEDMV